MKHLFAFSFLFLALISCGKEVLDSDKDPDPENEDYYDCTGFFLSGDYTSLCTVNTPLVNISDSTMDGGGTACAYIIPPLDANTQVETGVYFTSLPTSAVTQQYFENRRIYSDTSSITDSLKFHTDLVIDGQEAYVSEGNYANYAKTVTVKYKNVLVTVAVVYYYNWYPVTPCNFETAELTQMMSDVLSNM